MNSSESLTPPDYQDYIYRLTYWLLSKVAHIIPSKVSPNQITVSAFLCAILGTYLLYVIKTPVAYLYWILFNFFWFILDSLDGIHARRTKQSSEFGGFLDHSLDVIYFIFMLTVFYTKFDLTGILYIYILLLRTTLATMVFLVQCHTSRVMLEKFSGGSEFILFNTVMILSYCFPDFNPLMHTNSDFLISLINKLDLQTGMFMKLTLLIYFVAGPITIVRQFRFVKQCLHT